MKRNFYNGIIEVESIKIEIHKMELTEDEKKELFSLIDSNIHHTILDLVLSELEEDDKKIFLSNLLKDNHEDIWKHLRERIENIEGKIIKASEELRDEFYRDIVEAKVKGLKNTILQKSNL